MNNTWSYGATFEEFLVANDDTIFGTITKNSTSFCVLETQREAWGQEVKLLKKVLAPYKCKTNKVYFEFDLMRFSKRVDVVLVLNGVLICLEFKTDLLGAGSVKSYTTQDKNQVMAYADEFSQFHSTSRTCPIVPVLVVFSAPDEDDRIERCCDNIFDVVRSNEKTLSRVLDKICKDVPLKDEGLLRITNVDEWEKGEYQTVPTIVQAADRLFENQSVEAITRAGTDVTETMKTIETIIRKAEHDKAKVVCFVTGEPGAGKTLVGLKIAAEHMMRNLAVPGQDNLIRKVFLSGNYPLVKVLKESLIRNFTERLQKCKNKLNMEGHKLSQAESDFVASSGFQVSATGKSRWISALGERKRIPQYELYTIGSFDDAGKRATEVKDPKKGSFKSRKFSKRYIESTVSSMIQLVSHFRRGWEVSSSAPPENVFVFDEAQRAWSANQVKSKDKKTHPDQIRRGWSEPRTLLEYLNRHGADDWCVAIALVGSGQDIHTGEARIEEWYKALEEGGKQKSLQSWIVCVAPETASSVTSHFDATRVNPDWGIDYKKLHLSETVRSFKSKFVGSFVNAIIEGRSRLDESKEILKHMKEFPLYLTRDKELGQRWIEKQSLHGERRSGIVMSSRAVRLRRYGFVTQGIGFDEVSWFLDGPDAINSSCAMELAASEFKIQGLELDYVLVGWDGDFTYDSGSGKFVCRHFSKSENRWKPIVKMSSEDDAGDVNGNSAPPEVDPRDKERHLKNAYRVLLTRARQGMVIFIPKGEDSETSTLWKGNYDSTYAFLHEEVGIPELSVSNI